MGLRDTYGVKADRTFFGTKVWNPFLTYLDNVLSLFALASHTHGEGGLVASIGDTVSRPAVAGGSIYYNTELDQLELLNADGSLKHVLAKLTDAKPGYVRGMTPGAAGGTTTLAIAPGGIGVGGTLLRATSAINKTATVNSTGSLAWYCAWIEPPASGDILAAANIGTGDLTGLARSASDGLWYRGGKRVFALYPTASSAILKFFSAKHAYHLPTPWTAYTTTSPAIGLGNEANIGAGLPSIAEEIIAGYQIRLNVDGNSSAHRAAAIVIDGDVFSYDRVPSPNSTDDRKDWKPYDVPVINGDGTLDYYLQDVSGVPALFAMRLKNMAIPYGLAGA